MEDRALRLMPSGAVRWLPSGAALRAVGLNFIFEQENPYALGAPGATFSVTNIPPTEH